MDASALAVTQRLGETLKENGKTLAKQQAEASGQKQKKFLWWSW